MQDAIYCVFLVFKLLLNKLNYKAKMNKIWFKAKEYGYGWYPATWEGWLVTLIYVVAITFLVFIFEQNVSGLLWQYLGMVFGLSLMLIFICYKKGEKPGWRWGNKNK